MNVFQFFITCKRTNNANNATHYVKLSKKRRESSKRNYYIISPRVLIKAIIIISGANVPLPLHRGKNPRWLCSTYSGAHACRFSLGIVAPWCSGIVTVAPSLSKLNTTLLILRATL